MTDTLEGASDCVAQVREHYRATGPAERLSTALLTFGPEEKRLTPQHGRLPSAAVGEERDAEMRSDRGVEEATNNT
jgi:hypothetical protein